MVGDHMGPPLHEILSEARRQGPSKALRLKRTDYSLKGFGRLGAIVPVCASKSISRIPMENSIAITTYHTTWA